MTTSVIICTRNRVDDLANCLQSINVQTHLPNEVLIVDSSDNDLVGTLIKDSRYSSLTIKYIHAEPGLTRQRNIGIDNSQGDVVFFFDDDVSIESNYISEIMGIFRERKDENIGGVTGNIVNMKHDDSISTRIKRLFFLSDFGNGYFKLSGNPTYPSGQNNIGRTEFLSGCNMAYSATVLSNLTFDENMKGYCYWEDSDFSYRVSRKYSNYYTPYAKLCHFPNKPKDCNQKALRSHYRIITQYYLFKKNIPKRLRTIACFAISIIGELILNIYLESWGSVKGHIEGMGTILFRKKKMYSYFEKI